MIRIEEFPIKLFLNYIEFNQNTTWSDVSDLFPNRQFQSNRDNTEIKVNSIETVLLEDDIEVHISIHFIDQKIQSASISIPSIDQDYDAKDPMDFYKQAGQRDQKYSKWLNKHMFSSIAKSPDSFVLVGENKSSDTFIVIHWAGF